MKNDWQANLRNKKRKLSAEVSERKRDTKAGPLINSAKPPSLKAMRRFKDLVECYYLGDFMKFIDTLFLLSIVIINPIIAQESSHNFFEKKEDGIVFPQGFLKGVGCSTYQNGGHNFWPSLGYKPESNWSWYENECKTYFTLDRDRENGRSLFLRKSSPINRGEKVGISADVWNHMIDDIRLMKQLGVNAIRFELPWTDMNPERGVFNEEAIAYFDTYIDALLENGIQPFLQLFWLVEPKWFFDLGGFEKKANVHYYVEYAKEMFKRFGHKVKYWCSMSEPGVVSACGYILGTHPPAQVFQFREAGRVLANLFEAHIQTYEELKKMEHGKDAQIGIVHQIMHFDSRCGASFIANFMNYAFSHDVIMRFFKDGIFEFHPARGEAIRFRDERAPQSFDFFGMSLYSRMTIGLSGLTCDNGELMTDMVWAIRPQSMYDAIKEASALNKPIYITENGFADAKDDRRPIGIVSYINAVKQALDDGYDVRGYFHWSLLDNYEWNMGHDKKFGLYAVNTGSPDPRDKERVMRRSAQLYRDYVKVAETA